MYNRTVKLCVLTIAVFLGSEGSCAKKSAGYRGVLCAESSVSCIGRF